VILFLSRIEAAPPVQLHTLIVEDDPTSREAMLRILSMLGFAVQGVSTLAEGLRALDHQPASLILDLMLPDGNGMEILRRIRAQRLPIRVAVLTGADRPMIEEATLLSPDALFTKPIDLSRLLTWLRAV
jgi:DNA-binding response OmpR family regulator